MKTSAFVLGGFLAPLQLAFDRLTDELGSFLLADKRVDPIRHVIRQSNQYRLHVHRRTPHASVRIRYRKMCQTNLLSDIAY